MDPNSQLNQFASSPRAVTSTNHYFPRLGQPPPNLQRGQHQHNPQATPTSHQLVHQMRGVQLQDNIPTPVTPHSVSSLNGSFSLASGMSHLSPPIWTLGLPPYFPVPHQDHGAIGGQQPNTPHYWQQQQLMGSLQSAAPEPFHFSSAAQQPTHRPPGIPQWQQPAVQPHQQVEELNLSGLKPPMSFPPHFAMPSQDPGVMSSPRMHLPHISRPQLSSAMPSALSPTAPQPLIHPVPIAQQGYSGIMHPENAASRLTPPQPVQPRQRTAGLDPKDLPNAIQIMMKDKANRSGLFLTNVRGGLPPLVTTNYVIEDRGNASPRFLRSSLYSVPELPDMLKESAVPLSLVVTPFARLEQGEFAPPVVEEEPVRCGRCGAYMCSFMKFFEAGWKFTCPFCQSITAVPRQYFQHLDHTGMRTDKFQKPELRLGTYEFVVSEKYCREDILPKPPAVMFVLDVSYSSVKSGLVRLVCRNMKTILASLPREFPDGPLPKVGFITYNDQVQFYRISPSLTEPQMKIVGDLEDMFVPMMDGYLEDPEEAADVIDLLMERIQKSFANTQETETILGPAIKAGLEALKMAGCDGKLLVFNSSLPVKEAPGRLKTKDQQKLLGSDREKTVFKPQSSYYDQLGEECVKSDVRVDLFMAHHSFIDLATIGQVARLTSGQIYKYTTFRAYSDREQLMDDGERLLGDLIQNLERTSGFDGFMRVRTSLGLRAVDFYGNFFMGNKTEVQLAGMDSDQAVTVELKHYDKLAGQDTVYIQVAVLYTSVAGQRRVRVHNLSLNVCSNVDELYSNCDVDVIMNLLLKQVVSQAKDSTPTATRDGLINRVVQMLAYFRQNYSKPSCPLDILLPGPCLLLPLNTNSFINCDAISGGQEMAVDDRVYYMFAVMSMHAGATQRYLYPSVIALLDPAQPQPANGEVYSTPVRCTLGSLRDDGVYMIDNGISLFLWVGLKVDQDWIRCVFGAESVAQIDISETRLTDFDNPQSLKVRNALTNVREKPLRQMRLTIVRPLDQLENYCRKLLAEDKNLFNTSSLTYYKFFIFLHKKIRGLLEN